MDPEKGEPTDAVDSEPIPELPTSGGALARVASTSAYDPFQGASTGAVNEDEAARLAAPFKDEEHDIKPTGEVFVAQVHVRRRLNDVYRPGGWAMVPMSEVRQKAGQWGRVMFFQQWHLVANGRFLASAWGEQEYQPKNENTTEATALEGVKSNALVRCAKDLGIASECWDKQWCEQWKAKWAKQVWTKNVGDGANANKIKPFWRRIDAKPFEYPWSEKAAQKDKPKE